MKKSLLLLLLLLATSYSFGQRKDRIKGSKTVTEEVREIAAFTTMDIEDNIEVYLEKGEKNSIKIEADDNLHEIIALDVRGNNLRIYTTKEAKIFKKLVVRVTYTKDLTLISAKNEATIYAVQQIALDDITIKAIDYVKLFLNVNSKKFSLIADDKTETELNLKAEVGNIQLSKNAEIKSLVATKDFKCDLYQKATAAIEGETITATIRIDNNTVFTGNKLTAKNLNLTAEGYTSSYVFAEETISIAAAGETEINLYGNPKVEVTRFENEAKLLKMGK